MELNSGRLMAKAQMTGEEPGDWVDVPEDLELIARAKMRLNEMVEKSHSEKRAEWRQAVQEKLSTLGGTKVNMLSQHPLAKWGRDKRKEKAKAKIAAKSRRVNRGKR